MHFLIYFPGKSGQSPAHFAEVGLADLAAGATSLDCAHGPDGGPGVVCGWVGPHGELRVAPEQQTWIPAVPWNDKPAGRYWIGIWNDSPPTPEELRWRPAYAGRNITLGDGNTWSFAAAADLPRSMVFTAAGPERLPQARFAGFLRETATWFDLMIASLHGEPSQREDIDWWQFLVMALRLQYRITVEVASHLQLFDDENRLKALFAVLEGDELTRAVQEKKTGG